MIPGASLHRSGVLDEATGGLLRPGGLALTEHALSLCALPAGARVVDVGCGLGTTVEHLRHWLGFEALGVELDPKLLERAAARWPALRAVRGSALQLPLRDGSMDAVLLECTFSLVSDTATLLRECHRVLRSRGLLVVTDLFARNAGALQAARSAAPGCARGLRPRSGFTEALLAHGFTLRMFEDRSAALTELMARLIFAGQGTEAFWGLSCSSEAGPAEAQRALRAARPGYLLLIAERAERGDAP